MIYVDRAEEKMPICPCCGHQVNEVYINDFNDVVGCEDCIKRVSAHEREDLRYDY